LLESEQRCLKTVHMVVRVVYRFLLNFLNSFLLNFLNRFLLNFLNKNLEKD